MLQRINLWLFSLHKTMISEAVEQSRIRKAMRDCPTPILEPTDCIKKAVREFGDSLAVACSFGSCATTKFMLVFGVVLHMREVTCGGCGHTIRTQSKTGYTLCVKCGKNVIFDPERAREYWRKYRKQEYERRKSDPEKYNKYLRKWRKIHREHYARNKEKIHKRRKARLQTLRKTRLDVLGGECIRCGNKNEVVLEFHHINQKEKESSREWTKSDWNPRKFVLLCANCHLITHSEKT